ncbi:aspartate aminotransferase family protein [Rubrimonas cliftonensis]|uniref:Glutamate-1-semialdehyde 2,1-aminomutase n=1 Tax=Rubrimonas cliftonensis TaxID=89524 RepID=A0A1H4F5Z4_9RHOB|nr:aspartate aminotransferase family protein [Rubrimonas cliftonensis]SEA92327.1 glutamate-1-semialdehyde 2,1-aminomutase [Rubrimonas cliftonensis]
MSAIPAEQQPLAVAGVETARLEAFRTREAERFVAARPRCRTALAAGAAPWLDGVPMHWMRDWPSPFPLVVARAKGATLTDLDGNRLDDFCLGDTGSMFGHSPAPVARAMRRQATRGLTCMLPSEAALRVGALLRDRFGPFLWQVTLSASDANRHALRAARAVTGRRKTLVFNGCYHGALEEAMVELRDGRTAARRGLVGQGFDLTEGAVCVEFNDLAPVEAALSTGDVAAILTEPVMTNCCMVLPEPGFLEGLRRLADAHGALLIIDETHTQSSGPGGYARPHGLEADMLVIGKCVAGGVPTALWGMTEAVAARFRAYDAARPPGHSGMGTTLAGNPVQFACLEATLAEVATEEAFALMEAGAARLAEGLSRAIVAAVLPWHVVRVGARVEFICAPGPLRNGSEAAAAHRPAVEAAVHLGLLNRGCLIAPFHNMMLVSPATGRARVDRLIRAFGDVLDDLTSPRHG